MVGNSNYAHSPVLKVTLGEGKNLVDLSDMITSFKYKRSLNHDDTVDIDLEDKDAEWLIEQPCCYGGSPLRFQYGYIGQGMSDLVTLAIGDIEPEYSGKNGCTLSLTSVDASQGMKKLRSNKVWQNMRADQIIQALAELHGIDAEIQQFLADPASQQINLDNSTNPKSDSTANAELITTGTQTSPSRLATYKNILKYSVNGSKPVPFATYDSYPQGWISNHELLQTLTGSIGFGFISYVKNQTLYVVQRNTASAPVRMLARGVDDIIRFKIKYREISGKGSEMAVGTEKFDPTTTETFLMLGEYHLVASNGIISRTNPDGSREYLGSGQNALEQNSGGGDVEINSVVTAALQSLNITNVSKTEVINYLMGNTIQASSKQALDEKAAWAQEGIQETKDEMLTATLEEFGRMDMDTNQVVGVAGFATRYNGNWFVWEVEDTITKSGFWTKSELRKGEAKKGIVPTEHSNKSTVAAPKSRTVSSSTGWDHEAGFNINNPQTNPVKTEVTTPSPAPGITVKQR